MRAHAVSIVGSFLAKRSWLVGLALAGVAFVMLGLPVAVGSIVAPVLFAVQALVITVGMRRHADREMAIWRSFRWGIVLQIPASFAFIRSRIDPGVRWWPPINVALTLGSLLFFGWAAASAFRVFFSVPSMARASRLGLAGFALTLVATEWVILGNRPDGKPWVALALTCGLGAVALVAALALSVAPLHFHRRDAEVMLLAAAVVYGIGKVPHFFSHARLVSTSQLFVPTLMATGLVAAAALHPAMAQVGESLTEFSDRPLTIVSPVMSLVLFVIDAAVVGLAQGPWPVSRLAMVMAVVVALQLILIVWLSGSVWTGFATRWNGPNRRLRNQLRNAVSRGELRAHFQPILRSGDLAVAGYETLARWPHPSLGMISAQNFISVASNEGFLASIDHMMIRHAVEALPTLLATSAVDHPFVTVNVEPIRMQESGFADRVLTTLRDLSLDPNGLIIELTETAAVTDWDEIMRNVTVFKDAGIGLAIDDFGAGHANFGLLVSLDPDLVKLDRTLVEAAMTSARGRAVVRMAADAARSAGARIVAEGISEHAWGNELHDLGFDLLQGYAFGRPQALDSILSVGGTDPGSRI
jgi:EAL domain-containing protein (putative c-di-GMP-specific phosphodiesterase class I)